MYFRQKYNLIFSILYDNVITQRQTEIKTTTKDETGTRNHNRGRLFVYIIQMDIIHLSLLG